MDSGREINLRFKYRLSDTIRGRRLDNLKGGHDNIIKLFSIIVFIHSCYFLYTYLERQLIDLRLVIPILAILSVIAFWFGIPFPSALEDYLRKNTEPEYEFAFDETGASYKSPGIDVKVTWSNFEKILESEHVFLLFLKEQPNNYWLIPKRYFSRVEDITVFRELVNSHLS